MCFQQGREIETKSLTIKALDPFSPFISLASNIKHASVRGKKTTLSYVETQEPRLYYLDLLLTGESVSDLNSVQSDNSCQTLEILRSSQGLWAEHSLQGITRASRAINTWTEELFMNNEHVGYLYD